VKRLEWHEKYRVNISRFDAQHRRIFALLDAFSKSVHLNGGTLVESSLRELQSYAERHLLREELVLRVRGYPYYEQHKAEHDAYREKLASLMGQLGRHDLEIRIANFLTEWWHYHILTSDQDYARFFQDESPADRAAEAVIGPRSDTS
jgi:hemerythrin